MKIPSLFLTIASVCLMLNSCYFNSAGHLFTKAAYMASANSSDAQVGKQVYAYGGDYYVELPRYRVGKKVLTQYEYGRKDERKEEPQPTGDVMLFKIPADFAMYLTGRAQSPSVPNFMTPVADGSDIKKKADVYTIVRQGGASSQKFNYTSPNAAWWYTAGVLDWLCIDLPVTITENALYMAFAVVAIAVADSSSSSRSNSSSTATYYDDDDSYGESYGTVECQKCGGRGKITSNPSGASGSYFLFKNNTTCPECGGSGSVSSGVYRRNPSRSIWTKPS